MRRSYLYIIYNFLNDKMYVGVSINPNKRWSAHKSTAKNLKNAKHLHYALAKHLTNIDEAFTFNVLSSFESEDEAYEAEITTIAYLKDLGYMLYNETTGGDRPPIMFGEDNPFFGKSHSAETKEKISEMNKGKCAGEKNFFYGKSFAGEAHPLFGTKRPQNVLDALSKTHKGKIIPEELKDRWSLSHKGLFGGDKNPMYGIKGEDNANSGIKDHEAISIYNMYHVEGKKRKEICEIFKVHISTFQRVISSKGRFSWLKDHFKNEIQNQ